MKPSFDPRVWIVWWVCISILALTTRTGPAIAAVVLSLILLGLASGKGRLLLKTIIGLVPFLIMVVLLKTVSGGWAEALVSAARIFLLISSSVLTLSMGNSRFVIALRNMRSERLKFLEVPNEVMTDLMKNSLLTVPLVAAELSQLTEVQRSRGVDIRRGSPVARLKKIGGLAVPLIMRMLERNRQLSLVSEILGHDPFAKASLYHRLKLSHLDHAAIAGLLSVTLLAVLIKV
jgi:energy-coupling factor transporter transmembrane protein EcfT